MQTKEAARDSVSVLYMHTPTRWNVVLQCVAVCCSVLDEFGIIYVACNTLQHTATLVHKHCNTHAKTHMHVEEAAGVGRDSVSQMRMHTHIPTHMQRTHMHTDMLLECRHHSRAQAHMYTHASTHKYTDTRTNIY